MASFDKCVNDALKANRISKGVADQILASNNPNETITEILGDMSRARRETAIQTVRFAQALEDMKSHPSGEYHGLISLMAKDVKNVFPSANIDMRESFYKAKYEKMFSDGLSRFKTSITPVGFKQDEEGLNKLIQAIYGETVDDPAIPKLAKDWLEVVEEMRKDFNRHGGSISKNERYLLPQKHDIRTILKEAKKFATVKEARDAWKSEVKPMLDRQLMLDDNGKTLSDAQFEDLLDYTYDTISTGGLNKIKDAPSVTGLGKKLSRKGSDRRILYFKDAKSWIAYQNKYGRGDIFTTLTDHMQTMASDVALMERFGPNPEATYKGLRAIADRDKGLTQVQKAMADAIYNVVSGKINGGELTNTSDYMQGTRNLLTASTLGKAFLSSISDIGFQAITARYNNIPAYKVLSRQLSLMNPANEADRVFATKIGLLSGVTNRVAAANRFGDVTGVDWTAKVAEGVMRASLLEPWTDMGRKAFGMEFSSVLAENFGKSIDELDPILQNRFAAYGIKADDWDVFRAQKPLQQKGVVFADMLADRGDKFHQMVLSETDYAVPTPDARVKAITTGGYGRATLAGQGVRTIMNLKSFPVTIALTHLQRALFQASGGKKYEYIGLLIATTTMFGAISLHAKDIAAGRKPRPMDNINFWVAAFAQGGGAGIFGDFLFADYNRYGQGLMSSAFGPTGELVDKTYQLTFGNGKEVLAALAEGETDIVDIIDDTKIANETINYVERYTPDIWQAHLIKNALFDQLELLADPDAQAKYNRIIRTRQREYNQEFWWEPGEPLPEAAQ